MDAALSRLKQGFDSPRERQRHQFNWLVFLLNVHFL